MQFEFCSRITLIENLGFLGSAGIKIIILFYF